MSVDRYARQRALLAQDLVADAGIAVVGTGPALPSLLQCLALLGVGTRHGHIRLCGTDRPVTEADLTGQFLLTAADVGTPMGEALVGRVHQVNPTVDVTCTDRPGPSALVLAVPGAGEVERIDRSDIRVDVWGQVLPTCVSVGPRAVEADDRTTVLTAALATVCGGLLAQVVVTQIGAVVTGPAVLSTWVEERLWIRHPGIGRAAIALTEADADNPFPALGGVLRHVASTDVAERFKISLDGRQVSPRVTTVVDDDEVVVTISPGDGGHLPASTQATVRPVLRPPTPVEALVWSPLGDARLDDEGGRVVAPAPDALPAALPAARVVLCGAGALGSWASAVLAAMRVAGLDLCVVDMDDAVEHHNLNRQVLFADGDVGRPKAARAAERLREICPEMAVRPLTIAITPDVLPDLWQSRTRLVVADEELQRRREAYQAQLDELLRALGDASVILSCPDNHQTRWVLNVIAQTLQVPLVNGAAEGFQGRVHVCDPAYDSQCLVCWLGESIAADAKRHSCTDVIGDAPVPAVVTSAAVIGAIQAATLVATLAGAGDHVGRFHAWDGTQRTLVGHRGADHDPAECPDHLFEPAFGRPVRRTGGEEITTGGSGG